MGITERFWLNRLFLTCGILSSIVYVAANIIVPLQDPHYNWIEQTVSELCAIDAPTRPLWIALGWPFIFLLIGFGVGLWQTGFKVPGTVCILQAVIDPFWPPMHLRTVLAAGGGTLTDTLHIAFTVVWGVLSFLAMWFAARALSPSFRIYTLISALLMLIFGAITGAQSPNLQNGGPTPTIGIWERLNILVFMVWICVLASTILRRNGAS